MVNYIRRISLVSFLFSFAFKLETMCSSAMNLLLFPRLQTYMSFLIRLVRFLITAIHSNMLFSEWFTGVEMPSVTIVEQNQTRLPIFAPNAFISSLPRTAVLHIRSFSNFLVGFYLMWRVVIIAVDVEKVALQDNCCCYCPCELREQ